MQVKSKTVHELLSHLRVYFIESDFTRKFANEELPLRSELFNADQLEHHGKYLAQTHKTKKERVPDRLLKRLDGNDKILLEVRNLLTDAIKDGHMITPAGEWLLDNYYLIEEQIRIGKRHLPKGYSESLPSLANGPSASLPRVYDLALEIISHSDGRIDMESLSGFIKAYQSVTPLQLGELWAIPIMLRLALLENLRRVSVRIAIDRINQNLADYWARQMMETVEKDAKSLILVVADMARSNPPMESSFVAELTRQLLWKGPSLSLPLTWMEQLLSENGLTSNELVFAENQKQAADQVSVSNSIGSLRFLGATDWADFVEDHSIVEQTLRQQADRIYVSMDFATRDNYRHAIEKIAKYSHYSEKEVTDIVIKLAKDNAANTTPGDRGNHVGYYLIGKGRREMEKIANMQCPMSDRMRYNIHHRPLLHYLGGISIISLALGAIMFADAYTRSTHIWLLIILAFLFVLSASQLAISLVNWLITLFMQPALLPRMNFAKGIPSAFRSMVVVPSMLVNEHEVKSLVESLEVRFLANRDANLHFALLTDFPDAHQETLPSDEGLMMLAKACIEELNAKYGKENNIFFLFHRPRVWSKHDRIWMGHERKRGKLADLNALLRGHGPDKFSLIVGDYQSLGPVKYIITLDTDTQLPRDAAWKLVGTMAHPLNHPYYNQKKLRVTEGYGILQPRVSVSLPDSKSSLYMRMHSSEPGIDPYTRLTSDVYQDLFKEGSFIGKGIYDIDAFELAVKDMFPKNRILSHDLLEGCFARSGLITDVQFYEEYPSRYSADINRRHRWIRGDWQIASWSLPWCPRADRRIHKNPLSNLSRWKIFDNIRRSLFPIALTALLLLGWTILPHPIFWTTAVVIIVLLPSMVSSVWAALHKPSEMHLRQHLFLSATKLGENVLFNAFTLVCLPYEAFKNLDAIARTNWRMLISNRKLLQWTPSGMLKLSNDASIYLSYRSMWFAPFISLAAFVYISIYDPLRLVVAAPVLIAWILSPFIAWWLSKPQQKRVADITDDQHIFLEKIARKTWAFFQTFVNDEENWLPPDNFQEQPVPVIAHRTSPTNIGLALLANLSAYDFGYIQAEQFIERTAGTMSTLQRMERYRGHFYNWYDTLTLQPLLPLYISSVDSGNLAGHLLTLRQGIVQLSHQKILSPRLFRGIRDTFRVLEDYIPENDLLQQMRVDINAFCETPVLNISTAKSYLDKLISLSEKIVANIDPVDGEGLWWAQELDAHCRNMLKDLLHIAPWLELSDTPPKFAIITDVRIVSLQELLGICTYMLTLVNNGSNEDHTETEAKWLETFRSAIVKGINNINERIHTLEKLADICDELADMDYSFLYDRSKHLLTIGYNVTEHIRDSSYYDLLASEARLCTFVAISQGKLPQESWFALGRLLTSAASAPVLLSWSGSMFEYLMPLLVMPTYENTLLDQTNRAAVKRQIEYGKQRNVFWGISESGYNMVDANFNYQYRAFGVPGLGLKRGLAEDLVIAPYASVMSLMVSPEDACANLQKLSEAGFEGKYGFYEAIDFTPARLPRGQSNAVIRSFMVHHQGMSLLSLAYMLLDQPMQKRFEAEPQFQATLLLLQERVPQITSFFSHTTDIAEITPVAVEAEMRIINTPNTQVPEVQLLSNGRYHLMITNAGGGYSRWKNFAVTRWREDATCDNWGTFCYIRDLEDNSFWSTSHQPTLQQPKNYEAVFSQGRAEFRRRDASIETHTEIVISPEDDIEMRRVHITNRSRRRRWLDVTSYAEVVLAPAAADNMHPAFSKLFIQTEILKHKYAILCTRRPRSKDEQPPWLFHLMTATGGTIQEVSYETDRMKFIGRGNTVANPCAMAVPEALSGSQGSVLDPVVAIRYRVLLEPEETITIDMIMGVTETREASQALIEKYQDKHHKDRVLELAWTHSQVILRQINATEADAQLYSRLASSVIYTNSALRAEPSILIKNRKGQPGLWSYSISGDLPIVLLQIEDSSNIDLVKQLVQAHAYWRLKGLEVDLVIWNEDHGGYRQVLQNQILGLIAATIGIDVTDRPGGIFIRQADQISNEDRILLQTVARVIISDSKGSLEDQVNRKQSARTGIPHLTTLQSHTPQFTSVEEPTDLMFFNGIGGFAPDGQEYIIVTRPDQPTPAPWSNVLANAHFGSVISESGQSYTWTENAHELRLTPWLNDPVSDASGEVFYLRDEDTGHFWSPMPLPAAGRSPYIIRHGFGYSIFEHSEDGIYSEVTVFVDIYATIKFTTIKLRNNSGRTRRISATGYVEWVLGDLRPKTSMHIITELDYNTGAILAKNPYNLEFGNKVAFFDADDGSRTFTCDRTEFIGRNGTLAKPDAMSRTKLSGRLGAALDPCAAIQVTFTLTDEQEKEIVFRLGTARDANEASVSVRNFRGPIATVDALEKVKKYWQRSLGALQVETPDKAFNTLANGWLTYQALACRLRARSGYYQSGGAYGYRDQLQDVLSLMHTEAHLSREQIILCASRQFKEGDVQHWWHPPTGRGVRTRCSDDFLWLPFVTARHVMATGDTGMLDENIPFLEGRLLNPDEESYYDMPLQSDQSASLYEHCVRAIKHGLTFGEHGLPLMGSGDWNDGMDRVGIHGKGESVWLGFFLYDVLTHFAEIAREHNDLEFAAFCEHQAKELKENIDKHAWDGNWYRRAYFDNGEPLGTASALECRIDSISQSWSVLSGAGNPERSLIAMNEVDKRLVRRDIGIIQLLDPPFDKTDTDPGYIKGYVPGVRENGGQYSHAAIWTAMAFARLGDRERAWELLNMINPINHGNTPESIATYKVEPYVLAADVYAVSPHTGRGGWTWYTGSAGWMYQLIIEYILGLKREVDKLTFNPCVPADWDNYKINYRYRSSTYHITIIQNKGQGEMQVSVNGNLQADRKVPFNDDGKEHNVEIQIFS